MDWGDIQNAGAAVNYYVIDPGSVGNRLRIVSKPSMVWHHWEPDAAGKRHRVVCPGSSVCPVCQAGGKASCRYQMLVLDKKTWSPATGYGDKGPQVKVLEVGKMVINFIKEFASNEMYGNPMYYDIIIKRQGTGKETRYNVVPDPNKSELTPEELKALESAPSIKDLNAESTQEEINNLGLLILGGGAAPGGFEGGNAGSESKDVWSNFGTF